MTENSITPPEVLVIKPRKGLAPVDFKTLWQFRDLLIAFAERDVRLRYRQTVLGAAWVVLQPLLGASIFAIVFGLIAKMPSQGLPYFLVSYSGLLGWTLFMGTVTRISPSLVANASLIKKVFFPRMLVPISAIPAVIIDFAVALLVMIILMMVYHINPGWKLLLLPACMFILVTMAFGLGLIATSLAVRYRDIQLIVPFLVQLAMYASPVGYSLDAVPEKYRQLYFLANPAAAPIDAIRYALLGIGDSHGVFLLYSLGVSLVCVLVGLMVFQSAERYFADVI